MKNKAKGFTLAEILIVLIIIGVLTAIAVPNYFVFIAQQAGRAAQNNMITIWGAQKNYYFQHGTYYCGASALSDINTNLSLNIVDTSFNYFCQANPTCDAGYRCQAVYSTAGGLTFTMTSGPLQQGNPSCTPSRRVSCPS